MNTHRFLLIRHAKTQGNIERRYVGDPDEPLCARGEDEAMVLARSGVLPPAAALTALLSGPALRCRRTAELLYPGVRHEFCPMSEIDFGVFKGKNADELVGVREYERWLETGCMGDIPGGDSVSAIKERCCEIFARIAGMTDSVAGVDCGSGAAMTDCGGITAMVLHGGNIMAIMERFASHRQDFYAYHVPNCGFFLCRRENGALIIERRLQKIPEGFYEADSKTQ